MIELGIWDHMIVAILGLFLPVYTIWRGNQKAPLPSFTSSDKIRLYYINSLILLAGAGVVTLVWVLQDRPLASMGFRVFEWSLWIAFVSGSLIVLYLVDVLIEMRIPKRRILTEQRWRERTPFMPAIWSEFRHYLFLAGAAAVAEEVIFRGYFITYLVEILGDSLASSGLAIAIPAVVFGLLHIYQGTKALVKIMVLALPLGLLFLLSQSLILVTIIHFVIDVTGGLLSLSLLANRESVTSKSESPATK
ncbi:MAG: CPBP family intramembrane metalloprotease [Saprospiraceae bacterium]|nr:CPBP family intramembrane metalloprotease [Saprospiraceae bacterium]